MSGYRRFAVFVVPEKTALARFGASWLGWDINSGTPIGTPFETIVPRIREMIASPRRYGFHGTLKPPFRLAPGGTATDLARATATLAERTPPISLPGLDLTLIGRFLALVPTAHSADLDSLAFRLVRDLDRFRAPPTEEETRRRRRAGLSARQDALLAQWGYPYVGDEFRFHLTLTSTLSNDDQNAAMATVRTDLPPLDTPLAIDAVALVGEREDGFFEVIHRYALNGQTPPVSQR